METVYCTQCGHANSTVYKACAQCAAELPDISAYHQKLAEIESPPPRPYFANDPGGPVSEPPPTVQFNPTPPPEPFAPWSPGPAVTPSDQTPAGPYAPAPPSGYQGTDGFGLPSYSAYAQPAPTQLEKAGLGDRFLAALVDGLISLPFIGLGVGFGLAFLDPGRGPSHGDAQLMMYAIIVVFILPYWLIQAYFLTVSGQSLGKKAMSIRIIKEDTGENGGFVTNVLLRSMIPGIVAQFCGILGLIDVLWIFGSECKCLHDMLAGTIVVKNAPDYLKIT